jgi:signal transduction histidine kinase
MKSLLQSLLPQSLFGRLLIALLSAIGLALLVIVALIIHERRELSLLTSGAWSSADNIAAASTELAKLDPHSRDHEIEEYRTRRIMIERHHMHRPPQRREDMEEIAQLFAQRVRKQLGPTYYVKLTQARGRWRDVIPVGGENWPNVQVPGFNSPPDLRSPERWFDVTVGLPDGQEIVFRTLAPPPGPPLPRQIFLNLGLLTLLLALVLYFVTRSITRPLSQLARAADAIGRGEGHQPLEEVGARELRDATRAFNTMQDRLQRYLESRTRVLAAMSHDLRTPLTRLRLRAESIEDPEVQARFISDVEEMSQMVGGALNMFKGLNESEAATPLLIDDLLAALQEEYKELGASFAIEGHSNGPILAKAQSLKRCLSNLLHNAIKYGASAVVHIEDGNELIIRIRDEGPGIPEESLEQVFEPFFRVESSRNRDTGGTGLGLSIARDIAQAHGGSITLRNLPARGLEATLTLPRATT